MVHACWDQAAMQRIETVWNQEEGLTTELLAEATDSQTDLFDAVEDVLKGKELALPAGVAFHDKDGHVRRKFRVKWYESPKHKTFHSYAFQPDEDFPSDPLPAEIHQKITPYPADAPPVFFGHYWLHAESPAPLAQNIACLDYSVAKSGLLCAYRWNGETELSLEQFISVPAFPKCSFEKDLD